MKVALVHDYLIDFGGAERVLLALHEMYPKAPIYVSLYDKARMGEFWKEFENADIRPSWFHYTPLASRLISPLRFLLPLIWGSFNFSSYDLVITSAAWAVTKGVRKSPSTSPSTMSSGPNGSGSARTKEICYVHTPPRYLYGYDTSRNWGDKFYAPLIKIYAAVVNHFMRMYDFKSAQKVDYFIANSNNTAKRVEKFYRRKVNAVIYPPVDVEKFVPLRDQPLKGHYYLTGGRLVSSKNFDLIIEVFNRLKWPLKIYGDGPLRKELEKLARKNIEFVGEVNEGELINLYRNAKAFIVAQKDEDFGITPIEAMATGCPVIAYRGGGYLETVIDGKTGVFLDELTVESLVIATKQFNNLTIKSSDCINQAKRFSKERFKKKFEELVSSKIKTPSD